MAEVKVNRVSRPRGDTTQGLRKIVARRDGYSCHFCGVPTAATLEHLKAMNQGGRSKLHNLRLACPYCNSTKGDRPAELFVGEERWRLSPPEGLPESTLAMLELCFGWKKREGIVYSGSPHARLELKQGEVAVLVRAGERDNWHRLLLGPEGHPRVALAAWDFLRRHNTPAKPKSFIPKGKMAKTTAQGAIAAAV